MILANPPFSVVVLAGDRQSRDPVAEHAGVSCKALVPVAGRAVMQREVKGVLSLSSILLRWERIKPESPVREFMDRPAEIIDSTQKLPSNAPR